jgi:hypothetical protein
MWPLGLLLQTSMSVVVLLPFRCRLLLRRCRSFVHFLLAAVKQGAGPAPTRTGWSCRPRSRQAAPVGTAERGARCGTRRRAPAAAVAGGTRDPAPGGGAGACCQRCSSTTSPAATCSRRRCRLLRRPPSSGSWRRPSSSCCGSR